MTNIFERRRAPVGYTFHGRVSANLKDPGYDNWLGLMRDDKKISILLDGVEQRDCDIAEPNEGWISRLRYGRKGNPLVIDDTLQTEIVKGVVTVKIEPRG